MKREIIPVSIIVPTYNRVQKLFRLLKSLDRLDSIASEIMIIDDNSTDGTQRLLEKWKGIQKEHEKRIFLKESNMGPADSRNIGLLHSTNPMIAFTDDDVVVDENWIARITEKLLGSRNDKIVGVGGTVKALNDGLLNQYYQYYKILEAPKNLSYLTTVNSCFLKKPLIKIGGFDTSFSFAGGEDTDMCLRLRKRGYCFLKEKNAIVYHDFSSNFIDFCKTWLRYGRGTQLAIVKSRGLTSD